MATVKNLVIQSHMALQKDSTAPSTETLRLLWQTLTGLRLAAQDVEAAEALFVILADGFRLVSCSFTYRDLQRRASADSADGALGHDARSQKTTSA